jgi:hypothetical protein
MRYQADVTLIVNSTRGFPPKTFAGQSVEIRRVAPITPMGVDGKLSVGNQPTTVRWFGGEVAHFERITDVRIVSSDGNPLLEGGLLLTYEAPHNITGGVQFQVL